MRDILPLLSALALLFIAFIFGLVLGSRSGQRDVVNNYKKATEFCNGYIQAELNEQRTDIIFTCSEE